MQKKIEVIHDDDPIFFFQKKENIFSASGTENDFFGAHVPQLRSSHVVDM